MKKLLYFPLLLWVHLSYAQVASTCLPSAKLLKLYERDVKVLALERMYEIKSPDTALVIIPSKYTDTIWSGLAAINNLISLLPSADSIFTKYCIHKFPLGQGAKMSLTLGLNPYYSWVSKWASLSAVTGYTALDDLMSRYKFKVVHYISYYPAGPTWATIETDDIVNIFAFRDSLLRLSGITNASYYGGGFGDGNKINYTKDSVQRFTFKLAWGDCPAGCTEHARWTYSVDNSCTVTLLSVFQSSPITVPADPNCYAEPVTIPGILTGQPLKIFPNPSVDYFRISSGNTPFHFSYEIYDISGRRMLEGQADNNQEIGLGTIAAGMYMVKVTDDAGNIRMLKLQRQ